MSDATYFPRTCRSIGRHLKRLKHSVDTLIKNSLHKNVKVKSKAYQTNKKCVYDFMQDRPQWKQVKFIAY